MKLQSDHQHPHGLSESEYNALVKFTQKVRVALQDLKTGD